MRLTKCGIYFKTKQLLWQTIQQWKKEELTNRPSEANGDGGFWVLAFVVETLELISFLLVIYTECITYALKYIDWSLFGCFVISTCMGYRLNIMNVHIEPQRSHALNAIDRAVKFWKKGKRVLRPVPLRAPWLFTTGDRSWRKSSPHMWPWCDLAKFRSNHLQPTLSSPSTHQSWTASATTRRWLPVGQTLKHRLVHAHYYAFTWLHRLHMQTTSPWMETPRTSIANPWPRLPPVPYKTKFSHLGRKSSNSWPPLSTFGTGKAHCFGSSQQCRTSIWDECWPQHSDQLSPHITHRDIIKFHNTFPGVVFRNEDKRAISLRIYCPCWYF